MLWTQRAQTQQILGKHWSWSVVAQRVCGRSSRRPCTRAHATARSGPNNTDVVALGNLCVDVVIQVSHLPDSDPKSRRQLLEELTASTRPDDTRTWEVGGNCNFLIAAARLGLRTTTVGHAGQDAFGRFLQDVLKAESVAGMQRITTHGEALSALSSQAAASCSTDDVDQTLVCFVLVDPNSRHAFCSRYDFGPWPLLGGLSQLPQPALQALESTCAVFMNGFVFDELPLEVVRHACNHAIQHGAAVFFDPGPRCFTMLEGARRQALDEILALSEVVLMTEEEAVTVTGHHDPEAAARAVLARPGSRTQWCVVKMGSAGAVLVNRRTGKAHTVPGFKVEVSDTVGCGDSFASAIVLGYISHSSEDATLTLANAVGAATATGLGAGRNVARLNQVIQLLESGAGGSAHSRVQAARDLLRQASSLSSTPAA